MKKIKPRRKSFEEKVKNAYFIALLKTLSFSKTVNTVIEFWRQNEFFQINTPISFFSMISVEPELDVTTKKMTGNNWKKRFKPACAL